MKTTVIYHRADFDGLFCAAIARKFLPDAELIGWDFGDEPLTIPPEGPIYVLDLPVDRPFGFTFLPGNAAIDEHSVWEGIKNRVVWIDHHKSSIETHPASIPGYRIDGVAACRLAWQWFTILHGSDDVINQYHPSLPLKQRFIDRSVSEPLAVRLAGEYDIWDKRDPRAELFQFGLRSEPLTAGDWTLLLGDNSEGRTNVLLENGKPLQFARAQEYREVITQQGFDLYWKDLCFLACNSHKLDIRSQLFADGIKPHHQALIGFTFSGTDWRVSLYRIDGIETDILSIAKSYGGGGHAGACGFRVKKLPFLDL